MYRKLILKCLQKVLREEGKSWLKKEQDELKRFRPDEQHSFLGNLLHEYDSDAMYK